MATASERSERFRWYRLILLTPFVWQLACAWLANGIAWRPFGLPFQMVWQMAGVFVASAAIAFVFRLDEARLGDAAETKL